ncbi:MAG TPA: hypothetical protein DCM54_12850 [Gammaproteobacteria bacterium]|nr:hypothetical protein [Gammaproteobacteria bacterium]
MIAIPAWALLMLLFVAWILWMYACTTEVALSEARKGIPEGERKGVSIFPVLPIFPLVFWGIALFIDQFARPWGTNLVAGFHLALSLGWLVSTIRDGRELTKIDGATQHAVEIGCSSRHNLGCYVPKGS